METLQLIKDRIQSIVGTQQITRSMRLVSTAKVQKARARMMTNRPFLQEAESLIRIARDASTARHPYLRRREEAPAAVIIISGDRGLCGGYNMNVNRHAAALIKALGGDVRIITVGVKTRDFCRRRYKKMVERSFTGVSESPFYDDAKEIAALAQGWYDSGEVGQIYVVYTKFESMLAQTPVEKRLLPLEIDAEPAKGGVKKLVRYEPDGDGFLAAAVSFYLEAFLFGALLESASCEQSARITSMDAAVKNSEEMIDSLTLLYNQVRQGAITQEIIEIVGGAGDYGRRKKPPRLPAGPVRFNAQFINHERKE